MAGVPSKGSASIISGAIVFTAPENFEGISEITYHLTDANWDIDISGTVRILSKSISVPFVPGSPNDPVIPPSLTAAINTPNNDYLLILSIGAFLVAILLFFKKKIKVAIALMVVAIGALAFFFSKK